MFVHGYTSYLMVKYQFHCFNAMYDLRGIFTHCYTCWIWLVYILNLISASDYKSLYKLNSLEEPVLDTHYTILMKEKESRLGPKKYLCSKCVSRSVVMLFS